MALDVGTRVRVSAPNLTRFYDEAGTIQSILCVNDLARCDIGWVLLDGDPFQHWFYVDELEELTYDDTYSSAQDAD